MERANENTLQITELFYKINEVRINPIKLANRITLSMSYINKRDNTHREPNKAAVKLIEGVKSYEEAITFLKNFKPVGELVMDEKLSKIAMNHAEDIGHKGLTTNDSTDGKINFEDRFKKFGTYSELKEILNFTELEPIRIVMNLIICDGDPKRTNRMIILSELYNQIGIGLNTHTKLSNVCILDLCRDWKIRQINYINNARGEKEQTVDSGTCNTAKQNKFSKLKGFQIDLVESSKNNFNKLNIDEDLINKYDKELDSEIDFEDYFDKQEHKQIIVELDTIKLIKKIVITFKDGRERRIFLSKTFKAVNK